MEKNTQKKKSSILKKGVQAKKLTLYKEVHKQKI